MANQDIKKLSQELKDGQMIVKKEVTETLTEQDIQQRRSQLGFQATQFKQQIQQFTDMYNQTLADIADCDTMLTQFAPPPAIDQKD